MLPARDGDQAEFDLSVNDRLLLAVCLSMQHTCTTSCANAHKQKQELDKGHQHCTAVVVLGAALQYM
jgi:hypothetical protein